jgi:CDP-diacylglycerol--glycerol-3-phosphate 3-phosphatidyltransferase
MTRSWPTLVPAILLFAYFLGAVPLFWIHVRRKGIDREDRIEKRRPSRVLPKWIIYYLLWAIAPIERVLVRARVSPNMLTFLGLLVSCAAAGAVSHGFFDIGGWLYLFVGIIDIFDGRVARATGRVLYVILGALCGSLMVSYTRARAEGLGVREDATVGTMQRPERVFLLGVAMAISPFIAVAIHERPPNHPDFVVTVGAVLLLALTANVTAVLRFWAVFKSLRAEDTPPPEKVAKPASGTAANAGITTT